MSSEEDPEEIDRQAKLRSREQALAALPFCHEDEEYRQENWNDDLKQKYKGGRVRRPSQIIYVHYGLKY